jgi:hypothetical protein
MTPFKFGSKKINIPAGYHELTVKQFQALSALSDKGDLKNNFFDILEVFTGIAAQVWFDAELTELAETQLLTALMWVADFPEWEKIPMPNKITVGKKKIVIPKDLSIKAFGQRMHFKQVTNGKNIFDAMPQALAAYLQPLYTNKKFNPDEIEPMVALCGECNLFEAFPVATFFLRKYVGSSAGRMKFNTLKMPSSSQQELTS